MQIKENIKKVLDQLLSERGTNKELCLALFDWYEGKRSLSIVEFERIMKSLNLDWEAAYRGEVKPAPSFKEIQIGFILRSGEEKIEFVEFLSSELRDNKLPLLLIVKGRDSIFLKQEDRFLEGKIVSFYRETDPVSVGYFDW